MDLDQHVEFLTEFAHSHFTGEKSRDGMLRLKLDHTLRVLDNAHLIIKGENFNGEIADYARLAALYHDIGRFPQFAQYATFNDRKSVNHGRLGVLTLRNHDLPSDLSDNEWRTIRLAIGQHNVRILRPTLPEPFATITKIVRDADKIDILKVMVAHFSGEHTDPAITHGFEDTPGYSNTMYANVMSQKTGDYGDIRCTNDFKLLVIGWVYDLNFKSSISLLYERELVQRIFSFLPKDDKIQALDKKVNKFMRYNDSSPS